MPSKHVRWVLALSIPLLIFACTDNQNKRGSHGDAWQTGPSDAEDQTDDDGISSDGAGDRDSISGVSDSGDSDGETTAGDWSEPKRCDGIKSYPPVDEPFVKVDRAPRPEPAITQEWLEDSGKMPGMNEYLTAVFPHNDLEPADGMTPYDLYADFGQDVRLQAAMAQRAESLEDRKLLFSVLVDYRPVEFEYKLWSPNREDLLDSGTTTGLRWDVQNEVYPIDIRIPASAFDEPRMYEIETMAVYNKKPQGVGAARYDRYELNYGGYDRPSHPCFEPALQEEMNELERALIGDFHGEVFSGRKTVGLMPADMAGAEDIVSSVHPETLPVEPGEELTFNLTFPSQDRGPAPTVAVPFLDGRPLDRRWYFMSGEPVTGLYPLISTRKQFTMTAPSEPGTYYLQVVSWKNSYQSPYDDDGNRVPGVVSVFAWTGSNFIVLDVMP